MGKESYSNSNVWAFLIALVSNPWTVGIVVVAFLIWRGVIPYEWLIDLVKASEGLLPGR